MTQHLYVCLFSNGHIKVGRSINPESRIASHEDRVSCMGIELVQHAIFPCAGHVIQAEAALIEKCRELATKNHKSEWFEGVEFEDVCAWASQAANSYFVVEDCSFSNCFISAQERKRIATLVGINEQYLYQCLTGRRDMGPIEARRVEAESEGVLTRQMLCQKTWFGIWPELASHPDAPTVQELV